MTIATATARETPMNADLQRCGELLAQMPDIQLAFVFGSCAAGNATAASDVDVAVAADHVLSADERAEIAARVARGTHRDVDVVDLRAISGVILHQALSRGVPVLVRDKNLFAARIKRMLYNQADEMPYYRRILAARRARFLNRAENRRETRT